MIFKRIRNGRESSTWYCKLGWEGKQVLRNTGFTAKADAERFERLLRKSLAEDRVRALDTSRMRAPAGQLTIAKLLEAFDQAPGEWTPHTRRGYVGGLRAIVEAVMGPTPAWDSHPVAILTAELVFRYRQAIHRASEGSDDARRAQMGRTANTVLRSARSLFTPSLCEHYRLTCGLTLPDLSGFRDAPGFRGVAKDDYRIPSDQLIARTLEDLERTRDTHRDRYLAVWLAMGFGLRKSEAAAVRKGWFVSLQGRMHLELRAVVQPGQPAQTSTATKSGAVCPRIPVANGAWPRISPLLKALNDDAYVLAPKACDTYRADALFDEIALWMRELGWETQKAFHEWRAFAGCQVAMRDGLLTAKDWLRHASVTTTERNYGRYIRTQVSDTALDTVVSSAQAEPNGARHASVGDSKGTTTTAEVVAFPAVPASTPCAATTGRP